MNPTLLNQCISGSFAGTMTFGEVVPILMSDGIEWYSANLLLGVTTHYSLDGSHHQARWPVGSALHVTDTFSPVQVAQALRAVQSRQIDYRAFLRNIADAGVVYYTVHLAGRRALYVGRHGDFHVEPFPPARPVPAPGQLQEASTP